MEMYTFNKIRIPYFILLNAILLIITSTSVSHAQIKKDKEVINITSSFKPSIIKSGKIEFFADQIKKDTLPFSFQYQPSHGDIRTTMTTFNIKPLALQEKEKTKEMSGAYAKIGLGSMQNVRLDLAGQSSRPQTDVSYWVNNLSRKGPLKDQQFSNTVIGASLVHRLNQSQKITTDLGFDFNRYRQYGFDHQSFNFSVPEITRTMQDIHAGFSFQQLFGEENGGSLEPHFRMDHFSSNGLGDETNLRIEFPFSHLISSTFNLYFNPSIHFNIYKKNQSVIRKQSMFQLPIGLGIATENINLTAGVRPITEKGKSTFLPDVLFRTKVPNSDLWIHLTAKGTAAFNSFKYLSEENPFINAPDSITAMKQMDYLVGVSWLNNKGLQFKFNAGYSTFKNLPLYRNSGSSGKDFAVLFESYIGAINVNAQLEYVFSDKVSFRSEFESYVFSGQKSYAKPYGLISFQLKNVLEWKPFDRFKLRLTAGIWNGAPVSIVGHPDFNLSGAFDANAGVDFKLNKKWVIWLDLNNIANARYQRWYQYDSYGFNLVGGIRYSFLNKK